MISGAIIQFGSGKALQLVIDQKDFPLLNSFPLVLQDLITPFEGLLPIELAVQKGFFIGVENLADRHKTCVHEKKHAAKLKQDKVHANYAELKENHQELLAQAKSLALAENNSTIEAQVYAPAFIHAAKLGLNAGLDRINQLSSQVFVKFPHAQVFVRSAIVAACQSGQLTTVVHLLTNYPVQRDDNLHRAMIKAALRGLHLALLEQLVNHYQIQFPVNDRAILVPIIRAGDVALFMNLEAKYQFVLTPDDRRLLLHAIRCNRVAMLKHLAKKIPLTQAELLFAVTAGHSQCVDEIVAAGVVPETGLLFRALGNRDFATLDVLISKHHVDAQARRAVDGANLLHAAIAQFDGTAADQELVAYLLRQDLKIYAKDLKGRTIFIYMEVYLCEIHRAILIRMLSSHFGVQLPERLAVGFNLINVLEKLGMFSAAIAYNNPHELRSCLYRSDRSLRQLMLQTTLGKAAADLCIAQNKSELAAILVCNGAQVSNEVKRFVKGEMLTKIVDEHKPTRVVTLSEDEVTKLPESFRLIYRNDWLNFVEGVWPFIQGIAPQQTKHGGETLIEFAARLGRVQFVDLLFEVQHPHFHAPTALVVAVQSGQINVVDRLGYRMILTPALILVAAKYGQLNMFHWLIKIGGLSARFIGENGYNAAHHAAMSGCIPLFDALRTEYGVDIRARSYRGLSVLHLAAAYGHLLLVMHLIEVCGFDPKDTDESKQSAVDHAQASNHQSIIDYLNSRDQIAAPAAPALVFSDVLRHAPAWPQPATALSSAATSSTVRSIPSPFK